MTRKGVGKRVLVGVRLPVALAHKLKVVAVRRDTSVQALIEGAVVALLQPSQEARHGKK
ncbi:MAG: ribbon-helix-helix domain-containing protein [Gemmatimonadales bacterium]|jgi:hypothetical protein